MSSFSSCVILIFLLLLLFFIHNFGVIALPLFGIFVFLLFFFILFFYSIVFLVFLLFPQLGIWKSVSWELDGSCCHKQQFIFSSPATASHTATLPHSHTASHTIVQQYIETPDTKPKTLKYRTTPNTRLHYNNKHCCSTILLCTKLFAVLHSSLLWFCFCCVLFSTSSFLRTAIMALFYISFESTGTIFSSDSLLPPKLQHNVLLFSDLLHLTQLPILLSASSPTQHNTASRFELLFSIITKISS